MTIGEELQYETARQLLAGALNTVVRYRPGDLDRRVSDHQWSYHTGTLGIAISEDDEFQPSVQLKFQQVKDTVIGLNRLWPWRSVGDTHGKFYQLVFSVLLSTPETPDGEEIAFGQFGYLDGGESSAA